MAPVSPNLIRKPLNGMLFVAIVKDVLVLMGKVNDFDWARTVSPRVTVNPPSERDPVVMDFPVATWLSPGCPMTAAPSEQLPAPSG